MDRARPIAIDARAAIRPELGGVERWARELAVRLPALRPRRVRRAAAAAGARAPRRARVGAARPAGAGARLGARALLCPANLAPLATAASVVVIHDAAPLRHPGWYSPAYARWQRLVLPAIARRARRVITVSQFSRRELHELLGVDAAVVPGGVDERFSPSADPGPARRALGLERPYVLCVASHTARKNLAALVPAARALAADGLDAGGRGRPPAAVRPRGGARCAAPARSRRRRAAARPLRRRRGVRAALPLRGLRPAGAGGDGERGAGRGRCAPGRCPRPVAARLCSPSPTREAFAAALGALLRDPAERERLRAAGLARAAAFSWDATAYAVDALLSDAGASPSAGTRSATAR